MTEDEYQKGLREIFRSTTGKAVLEYLRILHVEGSALRATSEGTFYMLGRKELMQDFIADASSTEDIKPISVIQEDE